MKVSSTRPRSRTLPLLASLSMFLFAVPQAQAMQPLLTDDSGTQGKGGLQLELSYNRESRQQGSDRESTNSLPATLSWGAMENLDLMATAAYVRSHGVQPDSTASGVGNALLGAKWRFFDSEASGFSLALKPELQLPVSAQREALGQGTGELSGRLSLILSQKLSFGAIHMNAVLSRERFLNTDENPDTLRKRLSLAPVWDLTGQWRLALDIGVEFARAREQNTRSRYVELGAIYSPNSALDLAFGLVRTLDDQSPRSMTSCATTGVSWRF